MNISAKTILLLFTLGFVSNSMAIDIAMVVWRGETSAEQSFVNELIRRGYHLNVDLFNARQDRTALADILRQKLYPNIDQYDYVYTFGTTVSETVKTLLHGIKPLVFNIVADPVGSDLLAQDGLGHDNIVGVTNAVPTLTQIDNARSLIRFNALGVPYNPRENNSSLVVNKLQEAGEHYGFKVIPFRIRPDDQLWRIDLRTMLTTKTIDAVYLPPDSFLISRAPELLSLLNQAQIPTICAVEEYIQHGCLMGTVADYADLGRLAADIVDRLERGIPFSQIPLEFDPAPQFRVNSALKTLLGL